MVGVRGKTKNKLSELFTFLLSASVRFMTRSSMIRSETSQLDCPSAPRGHSAVIKWQKLGTDSHTGRGMERGWQGEESRSQGQNVQEGN